MAEDLAVSINNLPFRWRQAVATGLYLGGDNTWDKLTRDQNLAGHVEYYVVVVVVDGGGRFTRASIENCESLIIIIIISNTAVQVAS